MKEGFAATSAQQTRSNHVARIVEKCHRTKFLRFHFDHFTNMSAWTDRDRPSQKRIKARALHRAHSPAGTQSNKLFALSLLNMDDLINLAPLQTIDFFRRVIGLGFIGGILLMIPTVYLLFNAETPTPCERVFHHWLCIRLAIFVSQLPFRIYIYSSLQQARQLSHQSMPAAVVHLLRLSRSFAWRANQSFGMLVYVFFAVCFWHLYRNWDMSGFVPPADVLSVPEPSMLWVSQFQFDFHSVLHSAKAFLLGIPKLFDVLFGLFMPFVHAMLMSIFAVIGDHDSLTFEEPELDSTTVRCPMTTSPLVQIVFLHCAFFILHMLYSQCLLRRIMVHIFPYDFATGTTIEQIDQHSSVTSYAVQAEARHLTEPEMCVFMFLFHTMSYFVYLKIIAFSFCIIAGVRFATWSTASRILFEF
jgi:hypothetical protein